MRVLWAFLLGGSERSLPSGRQRFSTVAADQVELADQVEEQGLLPTDQVACLEAMVSIDQAELAEAELDS